MIIDIRHIRQVEALSRHKNFARAAQELGMTQPGLSRAIQSLEKTLDVILFDRNKREITPTVYGQHILDFGKTLLRDANRLQSDLELLKEGERGELTIGAGPIPAEIFLGKVLGVMSLQYPNLHVRVIVERPATLLSMLNKREIDVMVGDIRILEDTTGLDITKLPQHPICYVCRADHPYAKRRQMVFKEIFNYPIATPWIPNVIYQLVATEARLSVAELTAFKNGLMECSYFKLLIDVVVTSNAIGCGIVPIFADAIDRKKLVLLPVTCPGVTSAYNFVTLENYTLSPAIQILKQILVETVHKLSADNTQSKK
ncbi:MAG: LysR family transcriptional regulator [Thermodesulfobacteriota bacterium]|nr:LysR family transcriptional regulator [Thermodesulfobacteriota bacterium]